MLNCLRQVVLLIWCNTRIKLFFVSNFLLFNLFYRLLIDLILKKGKLRREFFLTTNICMHIRIFFIYTRSIYSNQYFEGIPGTSKRVFCNFPRYGKWARMQFLNDNIFYLIMWEYKENVCTYISVLLDVILKILCSN